MSSTDRADNPLAIAGHNEGPIGAQAVTDQMARDYAELMSTVAALLERASDTIPAEITTDEELGLVTKAVVDMRDAKGRAISHHKKEKEPYLRKGEAVDAFFFGMRDRLNKAMDVIGRRGDAYNQRKLAEERRRRDEELRIAREAEAEALRRQAEERRLAQEAEDAAARARKAANIEKHEETAVTHNNQAEAARVDTMLAAAAVTDAAIAASQKSAAVVRTRFEDDGTMSTMRQVPYVEIVDKDKLDLNVLRPFIKDEELLRALKAWAKTTSHKKSMDGAIVEMRDGTVYR